MPAMSKVHSDHESQGASCDSARASAGAMVGRANQMLTSGAGSIGNQLSNGQGKSYLGDYKWQPQPSALPHSIRQDVPQLLLSTGVQALRPVTRASSHSWPYGAGAGTHKLKKSVPHVASCDCRCCPSRLSGRQDLLAGRAAGRGDSQGQQRVQAPHRIRAARMMPTIFHEL